MEFVVAGVQCAETERSTGINYENVDIPEFSGSAVCYCYCYDWGHVVAGAR
jgi:hypothetical protein